MKEEYPVIDPEVDCDRWKTNLKYCQNICRFNCPKKGKKGVD